MTTEVEKEYFTDADFAGPREYWRQVAESDGFDIEDVATTPYNTGLISYDCLKCTRYPYQVLVLHYAMLGLHRYNMLEGTSFELDDLMKVNMLQNCVFSYYMTLLAHDPSATSLQKTFQVRVDEQKYGSLDVTCSIARPRDKKDEVTTKEPFIPHFHGSAVAGSFFNGELPDWPSDDALNDTKRFYVGINRVHRIKNSIHHEEEENMPTEVEKNTTTEVVEDEYFTTEDYEAWGGPTVYWRRVAESDGFDIEGIRKTPFFSGMIACYCDRMPENLLVKRYAMLGLHRYNMLERTSLELQTLLKFNTLHNAVSSYYMTLVAYNPADGQAETFQVRADERKINRLDVTCSIARPRDKKDEVTTKEPFIPHFHGCAVPDSSLFDGELPDWPSDDALNDTKRFYVLKTSERQDTDWIHLYLELLICAYDRRSAQVTPDFMSNLQILKVAIETDIGDMKPPNERLKAKCANVYITFKGLDMVPLIDEIGEHVERKAIVRRVISPGFLTLVGNHWSGKSTEKRSMTLKSGEKARSSKKRYRFG